MFKSKLFSSAHRVTEIELLSLVIVESNFSRIDLHKIREKNS